MVERVYTTFQLVWEGRAIEVSYQPNWLHTGYLHVQLRCAHRLPITQTGYRSAFIAGDLLDGEAAIQDHILAWLTHAANDRGWKKFLEDDRQLKLF